MSDTTTRERWGHAAEERPRLWDGSFETREQAIADGRAEYGRDDFWINRGVLVAPCDYLPAVDDLLDQMRSNAMDDAGEAAAEFPDVTTGAEAELEALLHAWARKNIRAEFWRAEGDAELVKGGAA